MSSHRRRSGRLARFRRRVRKAWRVFREDPDTVVTLSEDSGRWTVTYRGTDMAVSYPNERGALGGLYFMMEKVRGPPEVREAMAKLTEEALERVRGEMDDE